MNNMGIYFRTPEIAILERKNEVNGGDKNN